MFMMGLEFGLGLIAAFLVATATFYIARTLRATVRPKAVAVFLVEMCLGALAWLVFVTNIFDVDAGALCALFIVCFIAAFLIDRGRRNYAERQRTTQVSVI
jgi:hypothetical protein